MIRGSLDFMRGCRAVTTQNEIGTDPVVSYPTETWVAGYAPQHANALISDGPSFATRSQRLPACINQAEVGGRPDWARCWQFFARDRSLAAPDWKLILPLRIGGAATGNTWLLGDGLRQEEKPIIEDLVLYFRYRSRAIEEF